MHLDVHNPPRRQVGARASVAAGSDVEARYLASERVPEPVWRCLGAGERNLHLLWTRTLIPAFADAHRVHRSDVDDVERRCMLVLLEAVALHRISFLSTAVQASPSYEQNSYLAQVRLADERMRIRVDVETSRAEMQSVSIALRGQALKIETRLVWTPRHDPGRGSVMLFPHAIRSNHHFGLLALNRDQFADVCRALCRYIPCRAESTDEAVGRL